MSSRKDAIQLCRWMLLAQKVAAIAWLQAEWAGIHKQPSPLRPAKHSTYMWEAPEMSMALPATTVVVPALAVRREIQVAAEEVPRMCVNRGIHWQTDGWLPAVAAVEPKMAASQLGEQVAD